MSRDFPPIPEPDDQEQLYDTVRAPKECVEILVHERAGTPKKAALREDLQRTEQRIDRLRRGLLDIYVPAIHAGAYYTNSDTSSIGAGWTDVDGFDANNWDTERGAAFTLATGRFSFSLECDVMIIMSATVGHNEQNSERSYYARLYNHTTAQGGDPRRVPVGRNVTGSVLIATIGASIGATQVGDEYGVQIGGTTDTFTSVVIEDCDLSIFGVGIYRGAIR